MHTIKSGLELTCNVIERGVYQQSFPTITRGIYFHQKVMEKGELSLNGGLRVEHLFLLSCPIDAA